MPKTTPLPLPPGGLAAWRGAIEQARAVRKKLQPWQDANLQAYAPRLTDSPDTYGSVVNTNRDFTLVERKKADLFYQRPDVSAIPSPLFVGQEALLDTHTEILNEKLGLDGVNAKALVHQVLFDVLCPAGTGWTKMGYDSVTVPVEVELPVGEQPAGGDVIGLGPTTPVLKKQTVDVPVYEQCFWTWFSPRQALVPHDVRTSRVDEWPWVGYEFEMPLRAAKRKGWVPKEFLGTSPSQELRFDHGLDATAGDAVVHGVELFYKSALYRDDRVHPLHQTQLILIEGVPTPAVHQDSPYQTLDPMGRLTPDSVLGFPIHPLTIRTMTDSAHVPSDCTLSRPLVNELNKFRGQMIEFREAAILRWMYNTDVLPPDALNKIVRSPVGGFVGVPAEAFGEHGAIRELPHGSYPRENFAINDYLDSDLSRTHALDSNQQGVTAESGTTATEAQIQQSNVNARLGLERGVVLDWYIQGVTKYSALIQRFLPVEQAAQIVGAEAAQAWDGWRKAVPASLAFTALPDSALRTDLAWERKRWMDEYTFFANDPFINRQELLKQLLPRLRYTSKVLQLQPPEKGPEPTKPGLSLKGEDLNPMAPQFPILVEVLGQCGIKISPEAIAKAQEAAVTQMMAGQVAAQANAQTGAGAETAHGGKVAQMEGLSKHATDMTGGMQGTGQPAPMGAGGLM